jgi:uncharacterized membrane protein
MCRQMDETTIDDPLIHRHLIRIFVFFFFFLFYVNLTTVRDFERDNYSFSFLEFLLLVIAFSY